MTGIYTLRCNDCLERGRILEHLSTSQIIGYLANFAIHHYGNCREGEGLKYSSTLDEGLKLRQRILQGLIGREDLLNELDLDKILLVLPQISVSFIEQGIDILTNQDK